MNFHHWCLTRTNFTGMDMDKFFLQPYFWSIDSLGLEYVAILEVRMSTSWTRKI
jgi:hypothetical protein